MVKPKNTLFFGITAFTLGIMVSSLALWPRTQKAEARLDAIRTGIQEGKSFPRPINCIFPVGSAWSGHVLLGDTWPKDEPRPEVCHLKSEVERLGLVPKEQI